MDKKTGNDFIQFFELKRKQGEELRIAPEEVWEKEIQDISGRVLISLWVRMDIHNTGVNIASIYGRTESGERVKIIDFHTEGAYFYTNDGQKKEKLSHFTSDKWYSIYFAVNTEEQTYSVFIDGERCLHQVAWMQDAKRICSISQESYGGILYTKYLSVRKPVINSINHFDPTKKIFDVRSMITTEDHQVITEQLQQIIDQCSQEKGVVYLRDGIYYTGMLELKDDVTLYIEENAVLKGILDENAYPTMLSKNHPNWNTTVQGPQKALLYADSRTNIQIMGGGTIDGSGDFPGEYGSESKRVSEILLVGCTNVRIEDLYVMDAGMWTIPLVEVDDLYISNLNINSTWYPNRDGIDLCDCHHVLVEACNIKADDDALCLKSGHDRCCDDIYVHDCFIISTMANGIKMGTYSYGGFTNCYFTDCIIKDTRTCALAIECVDGGIAKNIKFSEIVIQSVESAFFLLIGDKERVPESYQKRIGKIENIYFEDIYAEDLKRGYGSYLGGFEKDGETHYLKHIYFTNVDVIYRGGVEEQPEQPKEFEKQYPESNCFGYLPASGYYIRHAEDVVFENCHTTIALPDCRPSFVLVDVNHSNLTNL